MAVGELANLRFSRRLLKCRENRYVLQSNTICTKFCLAITNYMSIVAKLIKKLFGSFSRKRT